MGHNRGQSKAIMCCSSWQKGISQTQVSLNSREIKPIVLATTEFVSNSVSHYSGNFQIVKFLLETFWVVLKACLGFIRIGEAGFG